MITAKEAQLRSAKVVEENLKNQFYEISKRIAEACESGQRSVCIENVDHKFFSTEEEQTDALFVLKAKYGYNAFYYQDELCISWY